MLVKPNQKVVFALIVFLLLLASFFAGRLNNEPMHVQAQEMPEDENRAVSGHTCKIIDVAIYSNRAHVKCDVPFVLGLAPKTTSVYYFAIANTNENKMLINRVMAIGLTTMSMNRSAYLVVETASAQNPPGCLASDCRQLLGLSGHNY